MSFTIDEMRKVIIKTELFGVITKEQREEYLKTASRITKFMGCSEEDAISVKELAKRSGLSELEVDRQIFALQNSSFNIRCVNGKYYLGKKDSGIERITCPINNQNFKLK